MDYSIRELRQNESKVLNTFLYEAIFIPHLYKFFYHFDYTHNLMTS